MAAPPRRIGWIVAPPPLCCLCKEPLEKDSEASSWNGAPAHRECVRAHLVQGDPAFRDWSKGSESPEEPGEAADDASPRDDDEADNA